MAKTSKSRLWSNLSEGDLERKAGELPLILAGPILRKVVPALPGQPCSVTVWLALRERTEVKLEVLDESDTVVLFSGETQTTQLGERLHLVAVTAHLGGELLPERLYRYNLSFKTVVSGRALSLEDSGAFTSAAYPSSEGFGYPEPHNLPGFALPPRRLVDLRILHASCRKPHGEEDDALAAVHEILKLTHGAPKERPHGLFLTGDQIYADDVADALLSEIMDLHRLLFGNVRELLPGLGSVELRSPFRPGERDMIARQTAGFSFLESEKKACQSHLLALTEYLTMYLLAWSDVLWPATFSDAFEEKEVERLQKFKNSLPRVRRALANVPVYMIFDDHELTDDWFLNFNWYANVIGAADSSQSSSVGWRVLRNGLAAYSLCQAWGNTPELFSRDLADPPGDPPGWLFLEAIEDWMLVQDDSSDNEKEDFNKEAKGLNKALGIKLAKVPDGVALKPADNKRAITWNYELRYANHRVIVLDTRTRRRFPPAEGTEKAELKGEEFAATIDPDDLRRQLPPVDSSADPAPSADYLTVVASAGPVIGNYDIEKGQESLSDPDKRKKNDTEAWSLDEDGYHSLLTRFAEIGISNGGAKRRNRVIALSGDVHYGFAARMRFEGKVRVGSRFVPVSSVIVQMTASSLKNQTRKLLLLHGGGYLGSAGAGLLLAGRPVRGVQIGPFSYVGIFWSDLPGHKVDLGTRLRLDSSSPKEPPVLKEDTWGSSEREIFYEYVDGAWQKEIRELLRKPQWLYRVQYLKDRGEDFVRDDWLPNAILNLDSGSRDGAAVKDQTTLARRIREVREDISGGREIVGKNNLGEIYFRQNGRLVVQNLWWWKDGRILPLTSMAASLRLNDEITIPKPKDP